MRATCDLCVRFLPFRSYSYPLSPSRYSPPVGPLRYHSYFCIIVEVNQYKYKIQVLARDMYLVIFLQAD